MYKLPELDYSYDALEDHISRDIMELHHSKHHQTYIDKLNAALENAPDHQEKSIEELLKDLDSVPEEVRTAVRNHGGGHYNHSLFWKWLSPNGGGEPEGDLKQKLADKYGSFDNFKEEFNAAAAALFGSGWTWLMPDGSITTTPNQDSPIMNGEPTPLLGVDMWEHAYYLDYQNRKPEYLEAFWNVVNWDEVEQRFHSFHDQS
jgi:Fe-Mn family superoxide dismutase